MNVESLYFDMFFIQLFLYFMFVNFYIIKRKKKIIVSHVVACPIVFVLFFDHGCQERVFKVMQKDFSGVFSRFDPFPQVFRQVKECLISQLHEMVRVLDEVACPFVFICFYDRYQQGEVLKLMKSDHIFSIFGRFCPLPQVFGQVND